MKRFIACFVLLLGLITSLPGSPARAASADAVVRAVLFYSPSCGHCHIVMTEVLPPLFEQYGTQLEMIGVDITTEDGQAMFMTTLQYFRLESGGVPFLVVGDTYLIGSIDIPEQFPGLIEQHLAQGGVDWPAVPGLAQAIAASGSAAEPAVEDPAAAAPAEDAAQAQVAPEVSLVTEPQEDQPPASLQEAVLMRIRQDPLGNSLSILVLVGMLASVAGAAWYFQRLPAASANPLRQSWSWLIPALCLLGLLVAGYLTFVETTQTEAVCGPVGDCNTVQQSQYARLFGFLPVGLLGLVGYVLIFCAWGVGRFALGRLAHLGMLALFGFTAVGLLFSIYLTFLEPFVIGATCAWCLTSAIIITLLVWLSFPPLKQAVAYFLRPKLA